MNKLNAVKTGLATFATSMLVLWPFIAANTDPLIVFFIGLFVSLWLSNVYNFIWPMWGGKR